MEKKNTYFVDIDGTIFKYRTFETYETSQAEPITSTVEYLRNKKEHGHMIVLTTARPDWLYEHTVRELKVNDIPFDRLVMGIERGPRFLINDKDPKVNEDRATAINLIRDKGI